MRKIDENTNLNKVNELFDIINGSIDSAIISYGFLLSKNEIEILNNCKSKILNSKNCKDLNVIREVLKLEEMLKPIFFKFWEYETTKGSEFISWRSSDSLNMPKVISSTFYNKTINSFCNSQVGIKYKVTLESFIGACFKDAATLIENKNRESFYTIYELPDGRVVNSYNLATPLITPKQIFNDDNNNYKSKHNEIILDSSYISIQSVICLSESGKELAESIGNKLNVNVEYRYEKEGSLDM